MKKKSLYQWLAIGVALVVAGYFLFADMGLGITPLTKFFVIFFGVIIGLQCIPAALMFIGLLRGVFSSPDSTVKQVTR